MGAAPIKDSFIEKIAAGLGGAATESDRKNPMAVLERAEKEMYRGLEAAVNKAEERGIYVQDLMAQIMINEIKQGKKGYLQRTRILLRFGANPESTNEDGITPLLTGL